MTLPLVEMVRHCPAEVMRLVIANEVEVALVERSEVAKSAVEVELVMIAEVAPSEVEVALVNWRFVPESAVVDALPSVALPVLVIFVEKKFPAVRAVDEAKLM